MKEILLLLVMFWNVENYFDTYNDPLKNDDAFTPMGENYWTKEKFNKKRDAIAKTIMLAADSYGMFPALVGLCEVENSFVLNQLLERTPLARAGYRYIHRESPDSRGIDVALLYREDIFTPLETRVIGVSFPTRDILYTKGVVNGLDTLHVFVNHWPSKSGGEEATAWRRMAVARKVKVVTDSLLVANPRANILFMGDLNDARSSESVSYLSPELINLTVWSHGGDGSYKYKGNWETIDHFLVSGNLLERGEGTIPRWIYCKKGMEIFAHDYLLCEDPTYSGVKPHRTLQGPRHLGGVSDHLPIILEFYTPTVGQNP